MSMVASEITVSETLCRKFWWHIFMTWPHLLPPATLIVLSDLDRLVPTPEVISVAARLTQRLVCLLVRSTARSLHH